MDFTHPSWSETATPRHGSREVHDTTATSTRSSPTPLTTIPSSISPIPTIATLEPQFASTISTGSTPSSPSSSTTSPIGVPAPDQLSSWAKEHDSILEDILQLNTPISNFPCPIGELHPGALSPLKSTKVAEKSSIEALRVSTSGPIWNSEFAELATDFPAAGGSGARDESGTALLAVASSAPEASVSPPVAPPPIAAHEGTTALAPHSPSAPDGTAARETSVTLAGSGPLPSAIPKFCSASPWRGPGWSRRAAHAGGSQPRPWRWRPRPCRCC